MTVLYFIIALGVLIFIHELGHFLVAKRSGVGVQVFSLGFGPRLLGFRYRETLYQISALPFGGYVKLVGESPEAEDAADPKSFVGKKARTRFGIVLAGPVMNLLLALLLMPLVFLLGRPIPAYLEEAPVISKVLAGTPAAEAGLQPGDRLLAINGAAVQDWEEVLQTLLLASEAEVLLKWQRGEQSFEKAVPVGERHPLPGALLGIEPAYLAAEEPVIDGVSQGGPAERAGLQGGDRVLALDNETIHSWSQLTEQIQRAGAEPITLEIERDTGRLRVSLTPQHDDSLGRYLIGIQKDPRAVPGGVLYKQYPPLAAVREGSLENWRLASLTFQVLERLVTLQLSYKALGGPVRIAQAAGSAARSGLADFLYFMAFLSLQLGILNLLPIPVLDGGHALFMVFEVFRRKPVSERVQQVATQAGLFLLIFLMLIVTVNDIDSVWGFRELFEKVRSFF